MILFIGDVARGDRDREGFQEIDFPAFFGRSPNGRRGSRTRGASPNMSLAHSASRLPDGPVRSCWRCPRTCCATRSRRSTARAFRRSPRSRIPARCRRCSNCSRTRPIRSRSSAAPTGARAPRTISPTSPSATESRSRPRSAGRTRSTTRCQVYAGNLGYGPNPKLQQRIRDADLILAVGPRLGEATTDGYTLITPDHPGQTLVHVHPDPNELGRVYHADLPICADMGEFAEMVDDWIDPDLVRFSCGDDAHKEWLEWSRAQAARRREARPRPVRRGDAREAPGEHDHLQRRRQFLGLVAPLLALRADADAARADVSGTMGYGAPGRRRRSAALQGPARGRASPATAIS